MRVLLRVGQVERRPGLDGHVAVGHRSLQRQHRREQVDVRGVGGRGLRPEEPEVVVTVDGLALATGVDDVDLAGHLVAGAEPRRRGERQDVVGVVVDERLRVQDRQLLQRVPQAVVGARHREVVPGRATARLLLGDDPLEGSAHPVDDVDVESTCEHHDPGAVRQVRGQLGTHRLLGRGLSGRALPGRALPGETLAQVGTVVHRHLLLVGEHGEAGPRDGSPRVAGTRSGWSASQSSRPVSSTGQTVDRSDDGEGGTEPLDRRRRVTAGPGLEPDGAAVAHGRQRGATAG